jgi:hypothetical protein
VRERGNEPLAATSVCGDIAIFTFTVAASRAALEWRALSLTFNAQSSTVPVKLHLTQVIIILIRAT